jgi:hypothetical protein
MADTIFNGDPLKYQPYVDRCIAFARASAPGELGTLPSFLPLARLEELYQARGLAVPAHNIPELPPSNPPMPAAPSQVQMAMFNATIQENLRLRVIHENYEKSLTQCRAEFRRLLVPIPTELVDRAIDPLVTDDTTFFGTLDAQYATALSETLEKEILKMHIPFDGATTFASRISQDELIHTAFFRQTGVALPDKILMFGLRASALGQEHLRVAREKYTDDFPALRDQSYAPLKARLLAAAARHEANPPVTLFGNSATAVSKTANDVFTRDNNKGTWTKAENSKFACAPNPAKWDKFCFTCDTNCFHDSAGHKTNRDGTMHASHDVTVLAPGQTGLQTAFKSHRMIEALALKHKHNLA